MVDELTDAIIALIDARKAYKDAMADCDGTWGYWGREHIDRLDEAKSNFADVFGRFVEQVLSNP